MARAAKAGARAAPLHGVLSRASESATSGSTQLFFGTQERPFVTYAVVGQVVPEPGSLALMGIALAGLALLRRRNA